MIGHVYFTLECFEFSSNFEFDRNMLSGTGARTFQKCEFKRVPFTNMIRVWIINYIHCFLWDVILDPGLSGMGKYTTIYNVVIITYPCQILVYLIDVSKYRKKSRVKLKGRTICTEPRLGHTKGTPSIGLYEYHIFLKRKVVHGRYHVYQVNWSERDPLRIEIKFDNHLKQTVTILNYVPAQF